jgi:tripartite-type tricarboxylate transporter receptor subunit TctC
VTSIRRLFALYVLLLASAPAAAQDWPIRPITIVVPFAAGGPVDVATRLLAPRLGQVLGQQIIIENVGGAGGMTGSARVAAASPDGYMAVLGNTGTHAYNQSLYKIPLYNAVTDFTPVGETVENTKVLLVRNDLPATTLAEFIAYAKANQVRMQFGSAGAGSSTHIGCVLLNAKLGLDITHVPYRGAAPAMQDLFAGRIDYMCEIISTAMPQIAGKSVRPLALLSTTRASVLPDLPTAVELGLPDVDSDGWNGVFLPKGTPAAIVRKFATALNETLDDPALRKRLEELGLIVPPPERRGPEYLARLVPAEIEKWSGPIKASGTRID